MTETAPQAETAPARWAPRFFLIWTGQAFSLLGSMVAQFALVWWFAKTTGSATFLAFSGVAGFLPAVLLGPIAGVLVDRWSRRAVMIVADAFIAASTLVLVALFALGVVRIWHIYAVLMVRSLGDAFHRPAMQASTSLMVPHRHLTRVAGVNQSLQAVMLILAPPAAAFLVDALPMPAVLMVDVVTALIAILPLCFVAVPRPERLPSVQGALATFWLDMREGVRYVIAWRGLALFLLLAAGLNFLAAPFVTLPPLLVTERFGGEAAKLGALNSALGIGLLIGALTLGAWGGFRNRIATSLAGVVGIGLGVILFGLSPFVAFWLALGAMLVAGFFMPIANGPIGATLQAVVAPEKQGRVFTLAGSLGSIATPLGMAISGPLADWVGIPAMFLGAGGGFVAMGCAAFAVPAILRLAEERPTLEKASPQDGA